MPNPGHRSRGCHSCRKMKTKCDELHPSCDRCTRAGRVCPGYREESDPFRSMNLVSERKGRYQKPPKPNSNVATRARRTKTAESSLVRRPSCASNHPVIAPTMSTNWAGQSVPFFFASWVIPETLQTNRALFNYFPAMLAASPSVCFTEAVKAAALAYMANMSSIDRLNKMAQESYGRALTGMMLAMSYKDTATSDETLAAVAALSVYEGITGRKSRKEPFTLHRLGLSTILKLRGSDQFRTPFGRDVFVAINKILLWKDLQELQRPTLGLIDWPAGLHSNPAMEFSARLAVRVVDVCGRTREAAEVAYAHRDVEWMQSLGILIQDVLDIDQEVQQQLDNPPKDWCWRSLPIPSANTSASTNSSSSSGSSEIDDGQRQYSLDTYPSRIDLYPNLTVATHWNTVRGNRLPIFRTFRTLSLLAQQHPFFAFPTLPSIAALHSSLNDTIADICASVPFLVGDVNASGALSDTGTRIKGGHVLALIWALHMMCGIDGLEPGLRAWMLKILARMGTAGGVKQGLVLSQLHSEAMVPKRWGLARQVLEDGLEVGG